MTTRQRTSWYWALAATAALGSALACSDEVPTGGIKSSEFAQARAEAVQSAKPAPAPAAATPPTPKATVDPISGVAQLDTGYAYDPTGKRDPFRSFIWDAKEKMQQAEIGPLGQFDLSQLKLVAVVWRTGNARALVQSPSGESYIVGRGAAIGKNRGHVIAIDDNTVVVKETYTDYLGQETTKDVEMRMRRSEGG